MKYHGLAMMVEIESSRLTLDLIPGPDAGWKELFHFALTYDGYKRYGSIVDLDRLAHEERPKTLDELRACLFFIQRVWHDQHELPEGKDLEKFKILVEAIREKVIERDKEGSSISVGGTRKIMQAYDSRAIAMDMNESPFTGLPIEDQLSLRNMCGREIMTLDDYLRERNKLIEKSKSQITKVEVLTPSDIQVKPFSTQIKEFIRTVTWTYASTMPEWPHEYIVRYKVDKELFLEMVRHIREHGYQGSFYEKEITYFNEGEKVYWTMGEPLEKTIVINRCRGEDTYEARKKNGTLPEKKPN